MYHRAVQYHALIIMLYSVKVEINLHLQSEVVQIFDRCRKAGLAVLKEAIRLAQESSDHVCLQHALAWLYTLSPSHKVMNVLLSGW